MNNSFISGKTITELYRYLQGNGGSYNDLRICFYNSGIESNENIASHSTRNKEHLFLIDTFNLYILESIDDAHKLIRFIKQVIVFPPTAEEKNLINSLRQDGWQIVGNKIIRVGHNVEALIDEMLQGVPVDSIQREWDRAKLSALSDPADALTAASSMIEATYKYILHNIGRAIPKTQDMRSLSKTVHPLLDLSPVQEADEDVRALLQGIITIVNSLGSIRTKSGDAHGASPTRGNPLARHAQLAINSAGAACIFLLETYDEKKIQAQNSSR